LDRIWIYADESCLGNQFTQRARPGGAAGLLEYWQDGRWARRDYWLSEPDTTNNRMALRSAISGLLALRRPCRVVFISDSQYLVRGMNEWVPAWQQRNWTRKTGVIEYLELWQELVRAAGAHEVRWEWVRGHAGHPQNEYANHLATRAARDQSHSAGLIASGFEAWLQQQHEERERYLDFLENAPPA
jgi:ribonuclease HI